MTKQDEQTLKEIAEACPVQYDFAFENERVSGAEIERRRKEGVVINLPEGTVLEPSKLYMVSVKTKVQVNHFRRIRKLYEAHGAGAVSKYLDEVDKKVKGKKDEN